MGKKYLRPGLVLLQNYYIFEIFFHDSMSCIYSRNSEITFFNPHENNRIPFNRKSVKKDDSGKLRRSLLFLIFFFQISKCSSMLTTAVSQEEK